MLFVGIIDRTRFLYYALTYFAQSPPSGTTVATKVTDSSALGLPPNVVAVATGTVISPQLQSRDGCKGAVVMEE